MKKIDLYFILLLAIILTASAASARGYSGNGIRGHSFDFGHRQMHPHMPIKAPSGNVRGNQGNYTNMCPTCTGDNVSGNVISGCPDGNYPNCPSCNTNSENETTTCPTCIGNNGSGNITNGCPDGNCPNCSNCFNCSNCPNCPSCGNNSGNETTPIANDSSMTSYHPHDGNVYEVGADGHVITLLENPNAVNPTYSQLLDFLRADKTDERSYTSEYECGDFAETLQNNAEKAGIHCAWVGVHSCDHAFNAFMTTDQGLVYIDDTGVPGGATLQDKILNCVIGQPLTGTYLFRSGGTVSMGCTVESILTFW